MTKTKDKKTADHALVWFLVSVGLTGLTFFLLLGNPDESIKQQNIDPLNTASTPIASDRQTTTELKRPVNPSMEPESIDRQARAAAHQVKPRRLRPQTQDISASQANTKEAQFSKNLQNIFSLVDAGDWQKAEPLLANLLQENPNSEAALVEMALIQLLDKKDPIAARQYLERAVKVNPNSESTITELLVVYQETEQLEDGIEFLKSIPLEQRTTGMVDFAIGRTLLNAGRSEEALEYLRHAMDLSGIEDPFVQEELAEAFVDTGRIDEGIDLYRNLADQSKDIYRTRLLKIKQASAYIKKGDPDEAIRVLDEFLQANPGEDQIAQIISDIKSGRVGGVQRF